jgi:predicted DNA-binding transcriptional regulator AlpA
MERLHRIIRLRELPNFVGLRRTQIDELIKRGEFPRPLNGKVDRHTGSPITQAPYELTKS